jgi:Zn-dependent protease
MLSLSLSRILGSLASVALVMVAVIPHEVAHGWVAWKLGDPTAKEAGRLSLNPLKHLDPFGSVVLPLLMSLLGGPVFAYAKPVPYNPYRLRDERRDEVLVALAGPACNLLEALASAILFRALLTQWSGAQDALYWVLVALSQFTFLNCGLAFFNLIPLPPLDGSKVISPLLSAQGRERYRMMQAYSMPVLIILLYVLPSLAGIDPLSWYLDATAYGLGGLLLGA